MDKSTITLIAIVLITVVFSAGSVVLHKQMEVEMKKVEKLELALTVLTQGQYPAITSAELEQELTKLK